GEEDRAGVVAVAQGRAGDEEGERLPGVELVDGGDLPAAEHALGELREAGGEALAAADGQLVNAVEAEDVATLEHGGSAVVAGGGEGRPLRGAEQGLKIVDVAGEGPGELVAQSVVEAALHHGLQRVVPGSAGVLVDEDVAHARIRLGVLQVRVRAGGNLVQRLLGDEVVAAVADVGDGDRGAQERNRLLDGEVPLLDDVRLD